MTQHTPGPWGLLGTQEHGYAIENTLGAIIADNIGREANARLIAQAPAMLEALKGCVGYFQYMAAQNSDLTPDNTWMEPIRAILRDVEGT